MGAKRPFRGLGAIEIRLRGFRSCADRQGDGIDVTLWWSPEDDSVAVEVLHFASESSFELAVDRARALDAFYHPFAYAAHWSPELLDVAA